MTTLRKLAAALACCTALSACGTAPARLAAENPTLAPRTTASNELADLPPPHMKLDVAVYAFTDQTGQHKPNDNYADYSFAVTQGGASILLDSLNMAGHGRWFDVLDRSRLGDLLQERQIIRANRSQMAGPDGKPLPPIPPLLNAGVILEGGIIGYDSNVLTGGAGATFLGIGASTQYRRDSVSVYLRAISVASGEVLVSITTEKTIYSVQLQGLLNRYVGYNKLLQAEAGISTNEPGQLAVRQAIEKAVYALIMQGAATDQWSFADKVAGQKLVQEYLATRDGTYPTTVTSAPSPGVSLNSGVGDHGDISDNQKG